MNRQSRALLTILVVSAVLIPYWLLTRVSDAPAPSALAPAATPLPGRGGAAVASTRTDPRSFNRLAHPEFATEIFSTLTLGRLVRINRATQQLEPWLAERWTVSEDARVYTLTLREGLAWSDGVPLTAEDVAFTFRAVYDPQVNSPLASAMRVGGQPLAVVAGDARTVVVTYPEVFGPGLRLLDNVPILPRHRLEGALAAGTFSSAWGADTPPADLVASGPFVLASYAPGQRLVFERNPRYWRHDERGVALPYLDRLTLELIPDQDTELVRLQAGQTDFMQDGIRPADIETLRPLEQQGVLRVEELGVNPNADTMVFNLRPTRWARDPRANWFHRDEFRQALSHAVDREAFADTVFLGAAVPIHGPVTPGNREWFWPSVPRYEFSREKAAALLAGLGLANRDADEWLDDATGADARFTLLVFRGNSVIERSAAVLREDFRQVGVAMDVVALEPNAVRTQVMGGDFDAALINFLFSDFDPAISREFWVSSGSAHFWNPAQASPATEWEREIDDLMARQAATVDTQERQRLFQEVQRRFAQHLPALYFAAPRVYLATSARLVNQQPALLRPQLLWSADTLAIRDPSTR